MFFSWDIGADLETCRASSWKPALSEGNLGNVREIQVGEGFYIAPDIFCKVCSGILAEWWSGPITNYVPIPSGKPTYSHQKGKGKSSSKLILGCDMLVPFGGWFQSYHIFQLWWDDPTYGSKQVPKKSKSIHQLVASSSIRWRNHAMDGKQILHQSKKVV